MDIVLRINYKNQLYMKIKLLPYLSILIAFNCLSSLTIRAQVDKVDVENEKIRVVSDGDRNGGDESVRKTLQRQKGQKSGSRAVNSYWIDTENGNTITDCRAVFYDSEDRKSVV